MKLLSLPLLGCFNLTSRECILCVLPGIKTSPGHSISLLAYSSQLRACQCLGGSGPLPATAWPTTRYSACLWCPREWRLSSFVGGKEAICRTARPSFSWEKVYPKPYFGSWNSLVRKHSLKMKFSQRALQESFVPESARIPHPLSACCSVVCDLAPVVDELRQVINISFLYL